MSRFRVCVFLMVPCALMAQVFAQEPVQARKDVEPASPAAKRGMVSVPGLEVTLGKSPGGKIIAKGKTGWPVRLR
jgi:hypothetical protein